MNQSKDLSLLLLRLGFGLTMAFSHGLGKVTQYWTASGPIEWADPLGFGPSTSLLFASSAEFFASLLVALGLATRFAALWPMATMATALLTVHFNDPFSKKEMALLYLIAFTAIAIAGAGRFSVDHFCYRRKK